MAQTKVNPSVFKKEAEFLDKDHDPIKSPAHYTHCKIEPATFILANKLGWAEGNAIKYLCRWRHKNGVEDLLKAREMIEYLIIEEESDV